MKALDWDRWAKDEDGAEPPVAANVKEAARAKARAEVGALEAKGVRLSGCAFPAILFVKGTPNAEEAAGAAPLSGADGEALFKAVSALGYAPEDWACILGTLVDGASLTPELLSLAIATLSPLTLVATDEAARSLICDTLAADLVEVADLSEALLEPGTVAQVAGLRVMALGGFEAALASPEQKQVMWARLKRIPPLGQPY